MICFHILKVKAETGATERRREAVTKTSEEDHDREQEKSDRLRGISEKRKKDL